jgi:LysM repeat protein
MQFEDRENQEQRNERPNEPTRNLPMAVLLVLVGIICALLYIGWKYMSDDTSGDDLTTVPADTVAKAIMNQPEEEIVASETENTNPVTNGLPVVSVPRVGDKNEATALKEEKPKEEKPKAEIPKEEKPNIEIPAGGESYTHTVNEGETFFGIANRYNIKKETLKAMNPSIDESGIKVGVTKLKIRIKSLHTVGPGDIIRVVSKKYDVPQSLIMQANKKSKNIAQRGEKLIIPFAEKQ